jgi:hypothetical protein
MLAGLGLFYSFLVFLFVSSESSLFSLSKFSFAHSSLFYITTIFFSGLYTARGIYNWHAFVDASDNPINLYRCTNVYLNSKYFIYNDNYHIEHHKRPGNILIVSFHFVGAHWSKLETNFVQSHSEYTSQKANTFDTELIMKPILFYLWFKRLDLIAMHYCKLSSASPGNVSALTITEEKDFNEVVKILEHRTTPIGGRPKYSKFRIKAEQICLAIIKVLLVGKDIESSGWDANKSREVPK